RHLIIRTQTVYGWEDMGNSSVSRLMQKLRHNSSSEIAKDLISSPTYDKCLARAILELCAEEATGVFNVAGAASCSLYKFALQTARIFGLDQSLIHPISAQDMGWRAARPLNSSLSVKKVQNIIKTMLLPFDIGLEQMLNDEL
ncbi:MAG: sugar nucleotide-binding protein, partial [Candidatus Obscuribacterales bacterium]|nr:sugar nucleotide-binding protein [Candidatus Obscuribacterales bacterium]